ncbi:DUF1206 domain-containing protein [Arthrobacter sp. JZ12]|uniref:DUF1206 domain-containing protein n=1 Tax=Arthrobacter sp. JZ12 TaxID=2654190 RepID=UPI002B494C2B|nr:DUF1206 domain-containing protein [Arthrobacter sp. JZ12]WRH23911.1 DUF1206 domain-containing protein [Arthrobacter sp. JZ12]
MGDLGRQARKVADGAEEAAESKPFIIAARVGYVAAGLLHILIGIIAVRVAAGGSGSADQDGAIASLAGTPGGGILLWVCSIGCFALALFLLSEALFEGRHRDRKEQLKQRLKNAGKAVVYAAIGVTFTRYALGSASDSSSSAQSTSAALMTNPAGTALLLAIGGGIVAVGGYFIYSGVTQRFEEHLAGEPSGSVGQAITTLGTVGYIAKGIALGVLGILVVIATVTNNPEESTGLDGALKTLQEQPFGVWILGAVAVGLVAYGLFMVVRARYQRM